MRKWILCLAGLLCLPAFAAENIGKEIRVYAVGGNPDFGVQFAHDVDFGIVFNLSLLGADLTGGKCFTTLAYRFLDARTDTYLTEWMPQEHNTGCVHLPGTYALQIGSAEKAVVASLLAHLSSLKLVLAVNYWGTSYKATHFVDFGAMCGKYADHFVDLGSSTRGCEVQLP